jgi:hypothetical protein
MALSQSVDESLNEASAALRNALAYAARQERPVVCNSISEILCRIDQMKSFDGILDKLDEMTKDVPFKD